MMPSVPQTRGTGRFPMQRGGHRHLDLGPFLKQISPCPHFFPAQGSRDENNFSLCSPFQTFACSASSYRWRKFLQIFWPYYGPKKSTCMLHKVYSPLAYYNFVKYDIKSMKFTKIQFRSKSCFHRVKHIR